MVEMAPAGIVQVEIIYSGQGDLEAKTREYEQKFANPVRTIARESAHDQRSGGHEEMAPAT